MFSSTPKVLHTRQYARHWAVHTSVSTTASDCKAKWCSEKTPTDIVATNTFGHCHTQVPRLHRNEWINWRKRVSAANSQVTMAAALSSSATHPKRKHYLNKSVKRLSSHIKSGRRSRYRQHKRKSRLSLIILGNRL